MENILQNPLIGELQTLFENFFFALEYEGKLADARVYSFISKVEHLMDEERDTLSFRNNTRVRGIHVRRFIEWIHQQIKKLLEQQCTLKVAIRLIRALCKVEYLEPNDVVSTLSPFLLKAIFSDASPTGEAAKEAARIFGEYLLQPQQSNVVESSLINRLLQHVIAVLQVEKKEIISLERKKEQTRVRKEKDVRERRASDEEKNSKRGKKVDKIFSTPSNQPSDGGAGIKISKVDYCFSPENVQNVYSEGWMSRANEVRRGQSEGKNHEKSQGSVQGEDGSHHAELPSASSTLVLPSLSPSAVESGKGVTQNSSSTLPYDRKIPNHLSSSPPLSSSFFSSLTSSTSLTRLSQQKTNRRKKTAVRSGSKEGDLRSFSRSKDKEAKDGNDDSDGYMSRGNKTEEWFHSEWRKTLPCLFLLGQLVHYASAAVEAALPAVISVLQQTVRWDHSSFNRRTAAQILLQTLRLAYRSPASVYHPFQEALLKYVVIGLGETRSVDDGTNHVSLNDRWELDGQCRRCCFCSCLEGVSSTYYTPTGIRRGSNAREAENEKKGDETVFTYQQDTLMGDGRRVVRSAFSQEEEQVKGGEKTDHGEENVSWVSAVPFVQRIEATLLLLNTVLASLTTSCVSIFLDYTACRRGTAPVSLLHSTYTPGTQAMEEGNHPFGSGSENYGASSSKPFGVAPVTTNNGSYQGKDKAGMTLFPFPRNAQPNMSPTTNIYPLSANPTALPSPLPITSSPVPSAARSAVFFSLPRRASEYFRWISHHITKCLLACLLESLSLSQPPCIAVNEGRRKDEEVRVRTESWMNNDKNKEELMNSDRSFEYFHCGCSTVKDISVSKREPQGKLKHPQYLAGQKTDFSSLPSSTTASTSSSFSVYFLSHPLILEALYSGTLPFLAVCDRLFFLHNTAAQIRKICHEVMNCTKHRCSSPLIGEGRRGEHATTIDFSSRSSHVRSSCRSDTGEDGDRLSQKDEGRKGGQMNSWSLNRPELRSVHFILLTLLTWVVPEMIFTVFPFSLSSTAFTPHGVRCLGRGGKGEIRRSVENDQPNERENVLDTVIGYIKDTLMMEDLRFFPSHSSPTPCPEAVTCFATMAEMFPRVVRPYSRSVMGPLFNKPLTSGFARDVAKICAVFPGLRSICLGKVLQGASAQLQSLQPLLAHGNRVPSSPLPCRSTIKNTDKALDDRTKEESVVMAKLDCTQTSSSFSFSFSSSYFLPPASSPTSSPRFPPSPSYTVILSIFDALHQMDFSGYSTLQFLCDSILPYLSHEIEEIRSRAVELCFKLVFCGCENNSPCQMLKNGVILHCGKEHTFLLLKIMKKLIYVAISDVSSDLRRKTIESFTTAHDYILALETPERLLAPLLFDKSQNAVAAARLLGRLSGIHPGGTYPALRRLLSQCVTHMFYANPQFPKRYEQALTLLAVVTEAAPGLLPPYLQSLLQDFEHRLRKCSALSPPSVIAGVLSCAGKLSRLAVADEDILIVRKMQYTVVEHLLTTSSPPIRQEAIRALKDMIRTTKDVDIFFQLQRLDMRNHSNSPFPLPFSAPFLSSPSPLLPRSDIRYGRLPAVLLGCLSGPLKERLSVRLDVLSLMGVIGALNPHLMKHLLLHASSSPSSSTYSPLGRRRCRRTEDEIEETGVPADGDGSELGHRRGNSGAVGGVGGGAVEGLGRGGGVGGRNWRVHMGDRRPPLNVDLAALDMSSEMDSPQVLHILLDTLHSPLLTADLCACAIDIVIHIISLSTSSEDQLNHHQDRQQPHRRSRGEGCTSNSIFSPPTFSFFGMQETFEEVIQILFDAIEKHESERHCFLFQLVTVVSLMGRHIRPLAQNLLDNVLVYLPVSILPPSPLPSPRGRARTSQASRLSPLGYSSSSGNALLFNNVHGVSSHRDDGSSAGVNTDVIPFTSSTAHTARAPNHSSSASLSSSSLEWILKLFRVLQRNLKEEFRLYLRDVLPCLVHTVLGDVSGAAVGIFRFFSQLGPLLDTHLDFVIGCVCEVASASTASLRCREYAVRTLRRFAMQLPSLVMEAPRCIHCLCGILKEFRHPYSTSAPTSTPLLCAGGSCSTAAVRRWPGDCLVTYSVEALAAIAWNLGPDFHKFVVMLEQVLDSWEKKVKMRMLSCILQAANGNREIIQGRSHSSRRGDHNLFQKGSDLNDEDSTDKISETDSEESTNEYRDRFFFSHVQAKEKEKHYEGRGARSFESISGVKERKKEKEKEGKNHHHNHKNNVESANDGERGILTRSHGRDQKRQTAALKIEGKRESRRGSVRSRIETEMVSERERFISGTPESPRCQYSSNSRTRKERGRIYSRQKENVMDGKEGSATSGEQQISSYRSLLPSTTKRLEMLLRFHTRRTTTEDWNQWTHQLSVALLESSPSPVFRQAAKLAEKHNTFAQHILHAAFRVLYDRGNGTCMLEELLLKLEQVLRDSHEVPTEVLQELLNLSEFMERVWMREKTCNEIERNKIWSAKERLLFDVRVLADCSERCHLYVKALHYVELQILDVTDGNEGQRNGECQRQLSSEEFTHLMELCQKSIYLYNLLGHRESAESTLRFIEANFARFTGKKASELPHCIDAQLLEKLQWWSKSQSAYAAGLAVEPYNVTYLAGYMRSIDNLGLYHETLKEWTKKSPELSLEKRQKIAPYAAHAAWLLRRWDNLKEITEDMSREGYEGVTAHFYKAVVAVSRRELRVAEDHIQQCRRLLDSEVSTLVAESYDRAYSLFVGLQQLSELEEFLLILKGEDFSQVPFIGGRSHVGSNEGGGIGLTVVNTHSERRTGRPLSHWQEIWERRLKAMDYEGWAGTIVNHEFLLPQMQELHLWLQFAALARQHGYYSIASEVLYQLRGQRSLQEAVKEGVKRDNCGISSVGSTGVSAIDASRSPQLPYETAAARSLVTPLLPSLALASFQHMYDTEPQNKEYTRELLASYIRSSYCSSTSVIQQYVSTAEERSSFALCHSKMAYWLFKQKWSECGEERKLRGRERNHSCNTHISANPNDLLTPQMTGFHHQSSSTSLAPTPFSGESFECRETISSASDHDSSESGKRRGNGNQSGKNNSFHHGTLERTILAHLDDATKVDATNGLIWHLWGTIHTSMARAAASAAAKSHGSSGATAPDMRRKCFASCDNEKLEKQSRESFEKKQKSQKFYRHVMEAVKGYVRSLCLMKELEDALGCLSLWFEFGDQLGMEEDRAQLEELLLEVPTTVWLKLKPQIVARLQEKENVSRFVSDSVYRLLEHVATEHPHALLYTLIVAKASHLLATQNGGETFSNGFPSGMGLKNRATGPASENYNRCSSGPGNPFLTATNTATGTMPTGAQAVPGGTFSTASPLTTVFCVPASSELHDVGAASRLLQSIKKKHNLLLPTVVEDAELVCREVVRCSATWTEKWLVAMERMKECEMEKYAKTLRLVVWPLLRESAHPETESEKQFVQDWQKYVYEWYQRIALVPLKGNAYRYEIEEHSSKLQRALRDKCDTFLSRTTALSSFSRSLAKDGRNLSAVVPGEYDVERASFTRAYFHSGCREAQHQKITTKQRSAGSSEEARRKNNLDRATVSFFNQMPLIACFDDKIEVLKTKQRPRRMSIHATDGACYHFLLKGQGDLRLDERVMQLLSFVNTLLVKHGATQQRDCSIQTYSVTPLSESAGLVGWVSDCNTMYQYVSAYRRDDLKWLRLEQNTMRFHSPRLSIYLPQGANFWPFSLRRIQMLELLEEAHAATTGNDLAHILWMRAPSAETWLDRRTTYVCSLATMSMVGHVMGLGDRHPSNILFHAYSGRVVHIDFGDCFEVAHLRKVDPENVPFRLTRMLIKVLEVGGIHGLFRHSCVTTMNILRKEGSSILALLEAFVHDPLVTWGMEDEEDDEDVSRIPEKLLMNELTSTNGSMPISTASGSDHNHKKKNTTQTQPKQDVITSCTVSGSHLRRCRRRETGTVLYPAQLMERQPAVPLPGAGTISTTAQQVVFRIQEKLEGLEFYDGKGKRTARLALSVEDQVGRLIDEARSSENVVAHYYGWCPFW